MIITRKMKPAAWNVFSGKHENNYSIFGKRDYQEYYGAADFCIIPSNFEPFGLVQLEAMCMGCILIGSRVGGINDTVLDIHDYPEESTGRLVPPRNSTALLGPW